MIARIWKCMLIAVLIVVLTGCWNRRELEELSIAVAMGLDMSENGQYMVSIQLVNPGEIASKSSGGVGGSPVTTYRSQGRTVFEALRKMTTKLNNKIYLSHLRMLVIGEELAREGIGDALDYLSRDHEFRSDFFIVVAKKEKAGNILDILTPQEKIPANKMYTSLDLAEKTWGATTKLTLDDLLEDLENEGKSSVLTGLMMRGSHNEGQKLDNMHSSVVSTILQYNGLAVFKNDKLIGWLNEKESKGYNYSQGNVKSTVGVNECPEGVIDVELIRTETKVKSTLNSEGDPEINIKVYAEGNVGDVTCTMNMTDPSSMEQIEQTSAQNIKDTIMSAIRITQTKFKTDIFGFGEVVHRSNPDYWKKHKRHWDRIFSGLTVNVTVNVDIHRIGTINEPIQSRVRK